MKVVSDKITECEAELEQLRIQRDAKLRKIGNILGDTCIIDKNEVCIHQGVESHADFGVFSSIGQQWSGLDLGNSP